VKYRLVYAERAVRDISRLDAHTKTRIRQALEKYAEMPSDYALKMADPALGMYRYREITGLFSILRARI
jgi:mRNA-degrading endonuclease RelE of RelBE toxin-antitoxin system